MALEVYKVETIELQDGTEVELRPLSINRLKKFMAKIAEFGEPITTIKGEKKEDTEKRQEEIGMNRLVDAATLCLSNKIPELCADREKLEEALDMPTIYKIIDLCGGIKLNDPNLIAAATAAMRENIAAGTTQTQPVQKVKPWSGVPAHGKTLKNQKKI